MRVLPCKWNKKLFIQFLALFDFKHMCSFFLPCEGTIRRLTLNTECQYLDLGISSVHNDMKYNLILYKLLRLWNLVTST
jgi:hypothetical protein